MATTVLIQEQKEALAAQAVQARAKNPQVMQTHNEESSDDDSPPQNIGNPFASVKNQQQSRN